MSKFKVEKQEADYYRLSGQIDEDVNFSDYPLEGTSLTLDLDGISAINSCGIREWIKWMQKAESVSSIVFKNCPKIIVDQMNMVEGFFPNNAKVDSFYVPYYSDETGEERNILFESNKEFTGSNLKLPDQVKDSEGNEMEIDVIETKYFKFISRITD